MKVDICVNDYFGMSRQEFYWFVIGKPEQTTSLPDSSINK
jgi:hypothetical protein